MIGRVKTLLFLCFYVPVFLLLSSPSPPAGPLHPPPDLYSLIFKREIITADDWKCNVYLKNSRIYCILSSKLKGLHHPQKP